jgi:hypothetical protein
MIPRNDDACSDDLPDEDDYPELTDDELEELASVLIEALTIPPPPTGQNPLDQDGYFRSPGDGG